MVSGNDNNKDKFTEEYLKKFVEKLLVVADHVDVDGLANHVRGDRDVVRVAPVGPSVDVLPRVGGIGGGPVRGQGGAGGAVCRGRRQ